MTVVAVLGLTAPVAQAKDGSRSAAAKTGTAAKAGTDKAFKAAKKEYQQRIHNKKASERKAALKLLADFPTGEAADLVYVTLLDDTAADVRDAAVDQLKPVVCMRAVVGAREAVFFERLVKQHARIVAGERSARAIGALEAGREADNQHACTKGAEGGDR